MEQNQFIRKIVPVMLTLVVLGIFLSLYLLKYIPARQNDYNSRASLELEQIVKAVKEKIPAIPAQSGPMLHQSFIPTPKKRPVRSFIPLFTLPLPNRIPC